MSIQTKLIILASISGINLGIMIALIIDYRKLKKTAAYYLEMFRESKD